MQKPKLQVKSQKFLFPSNWETTRLEDVVERMKAGGTPRRTIAEYWDGDISFVKIEDISGAQKYLFATKERITRLGLKNSSAWIIPKNSVLFSMYASIGEVAINKVPVATNQAILGIIPNKKTTSDYLFYCLKKFGNQLAAYNIQSTQKNITLQIAKAFQVPLPSLPEQKKIVYILDSIQDAIRAQERIIEKTKELKKSLLNEIFNSKIKNKKSKLKFKIQRWIKLKKVADVVMGQSPSSRFYNIEKKGLPFLQGKAEFGEISPYPVKWCSQLIKIAKRNDVLISVRAPVGNTNLADQDYCIGRGVAAIRPQSNLNSFYLFNYLQIAKEQIANFGSGSTFKAINREVLENFQIPILPFPEQCEIADILQTIDQKIEIEQKKKALYEELFKTMLNKLMTGKIKVDNLKL